MSRLEASADLRAAAPALFAPVAGHPTIGLAVSGGADSLALMLLAAGWARTLPVSPRLIVYSVDHGLRPEAAAEVAFVVGQAQRLGLEARGLHWTAAKPAAGVQAAARAARYRLIGEAMRADGAAVLLTAHHREDQAETVLMRLAHGSGLEGLRGMDAMAEVEGVAVFRPLLGVARERLRAVVGEAGVVPVADPSNEDLHYERVRWRRASPLLAELGLDGEVLGQFARRAGEADAALAQWTDEAFVRLVGFDAFGAARMPLQGLAPLPRAVGVKLLGRVLALTGGGQRPHALGALERLHDRLVGGAAFSGATTLGAAIHRRGGELWFSREPGRTEVPAARLSPAQSLLWDRRFRIANRSAGAIDVRMAGSLSRQAAERLVGRRLTAPAAAIRSAPLVSGAQGEILSLGMYRLAEGIGVDFVAAQAE